MKWNILCSIIAISARGLVAATPSWPNTPFKTSGRQIIDQSGNNVVYAGVNWPGAADTMLPEGLQYQSIKNIVNKISSLGANVIRLTYAIEMIDDIYSYSPNSTLQNTLINALGTVNGTIVLNEILKKNSQFTPYTTRLEVCIVCRACEHNHSYSSRSSMQLQLNVQTNRSTSILTITSRRRSGAAAMTTEMPGSVTPTST